MNAWIKRWILRKCAPPQRDPRLILRTCPDCSKQDWVVRGSGARRHEPNSPRCRSCAALKRDKGVMIGETLELYESPPDRFIPRLEYNISRLATMLGE